MCVSLVSFFYSHQGDVPPPPPPPPAAAAAAAAAAAVIEEYLPPTYPIPGTSDKLQQRKHEANIAVDEEHGARDFSPGAVSKNTFHRLTLLFCSGDAGWGFCICECVCPCVCVCFFFFFFFAVVSSISSIYLTAKRFFLFSLSFSFSPPTCSYLFVFARWLRRKNAALLFLCGKHRRRRVAGGFALINGAVFISVCVITTGMLTSTLDSTNTIPRPTWGGGMSSLCWSSLQSNV